MFDLIDLKRGHGKLFANKDKRVSMTIHVAIFNKSRDKILLVHDLGGSENGLKIGGVKPERWVLITGKVHAGETPYEAANRETREEGNLLIEDVPFFISRLPALTEKKGKEESIHMEIFFIGELKNSNEKLPEKTFPVRDPLRHVVEGYWHSIDDLPTDEEARRSCYLFDQAKLERKPIEQLEELPYFSIDKETVFPISPPHLRFIRNKGICDSPEELDSKIQNLLAIAKTSFFRLPLIPKTSL
ncbi:MAG: NUDIX hydrolase [Patescibacteria group bacterium]